MKVTVQRQLEATCVLTEEEARYLRALLQNYRGSGEEPEDEFELRLGMYQGLTNALAPPSFPEGAACLRGS